jgi:hypothetical protein
VLVRCYPFLVVGEVKGDLTPSLALKMITNNFQFSYKGIDYGFMIDLGEIALEKSESELQSVSAATGDFFRN